MAPFNRWGLWRGRALRLDLARSGLSIVLRLDGRSAPKVGHSGRPWDFLKVDCPLRAGSGLLSSVRHLRLYSSRYDAPYRRW